MYHEDREIVCHLLQRLAITMARDCALMLDKRRPSFVSSFMDGDQDKKEPGRV